MDPNSAEETPDDRTCDIDPGDDANPTLPLSTEPVIDSNETQMVVLYKEPTSGKFRQQQNFRLNPFLMINSLFLAYDLCFQFRKKPLQSRPKVRKWVYCSDAAGIMHRAVWGRSDGEGIENAWALVAPVLVKPTRMSLEPVQVALSVKQVAMCQVRGLSVALRIALGQNASETESEIDGPMSSTASVVKSSHMELEATGFRRSDGVGNGSAK
ncbi:hypothetical protein B0H11DRAFT_1900374 [Mycena galericulata]|nr:hypothetical protein B0H11DRAFT_1917090 [Mycena galericulata]KAJ7509955.1 hypothetical protein B0H11DRAFT_1900374 [Mycena galericulata]